MYVGCLMLLYLSDERVLMKGDRNLVFDSHETLPRNSCGFVVQYAYTFYLNVYNVHIRIDCLHSI